MFSPLGLSAWRSKLAPAEYRQHKACCLEKQESAVSARSGAARRSPPTSSSAFASNAAREAHRASAAVSAHAVWSVPRYSSAVSTPSSQAAVSVLRTVDAKFTPKNPSTITWRLERSFVAMASIVSADRLWPASSAVSAASSGGRSALVSFSKQGGCSNGSTPVVSFSYNESAHASWSQPGHWSSSRAS